MKQILLSNDRAFVARVPRVAVEPGSVLVQTHYSLISTGTELASLKAVLTQHESGAIGKAVEISSRAAFYLSKAIHDPGKAARRIRMIAADRVRRIAEATRRVATPSRTSVVEDPQWRSIGAIEFEAAGSGLRFVSDSTDTGYQVISRRIEMKHGGDGSSVTQSGDSAAETALVVSVKGCITDAPYTLGILNGDQSAWIGQFTLEPGVVGEDLLFDTASADGVYIVLANGGVGGGRAELAELAVRLEETTDGLPASETGQIGWNVGYSAAGEVVAVGEGVSGFRVGDFVACAGAGQANHAEFISVKRNLCVLVPENTPLQWAATTTVGSIAMQGLRRADPRLGEVVCVMGLGLIGLITVQLLKAAGCKVVGLDLDARRVAKAVTLGADAAVIDTQECVRRCLHMTAGNGADATIITAATKSDALINDAMRTTRRRGRVVVVGDIGMKVERPEFYRKEIDLLMSTSYGPGRYDANYEIDGRDYPYAYVRWTQNRNMSAYLDLVAARGINVEALIEQIVPIEEAPAAYDALARSSTPPLGVVLAYKPQAIAASGEMTVDRRDSTRVSIRGARKPHLERIGYCLVGAGGFGMSMLVPQMDKRRDVFQLKGVVSRDPVRGGNFARQRGVEVLATDIDAILGDDEVDLVVIATRHHEHADQVVKALSAGKHVFVEKPLALSWKELDRIRSAYQETEGQLLMVGFNRGFAPAAVAVKKELESRSAPLVVNYRLNGGYIPADSWIQGTQGGGRNLGEACHMYDFFAGLVGAPVTSVSARSIGPGASAYLANDNFVATIGYEDGSLCNLVYTAVGPKSGMPKERIEIFCEGRGFLIDDFTRCTAYPTDTVLWQASQPDKGHAAELSLLADALRDGNSEGPLPVARLFETTAVSLAVEDMLQGRSS